jgi:drug/metabolite transporter (DMT)-like permease
MLNSDPKGPLVRVVAALTGLVVLGWGLTSMLQKGDLHYRNWFGQLVFSPFAILFGLAIILSALFKPEILGRPRPPKR